jgi:NADH-quinone oxidoreductase subunit F
VGTVRQEEALERLVAGADATDLLHEIGRAMGDASICGLGHTAALAVRSAIGLGLIGNGARR